MHSTGRRRSVPAVAIVAAAFLFAAMSPALAQASGDVKIEWLTWSFFRITSPGGKIILTNPWVTNPDSQITMDDIDAADAILVASGHGDEVGQTVEIAGKTGATVVTTWEMAGAAFKDKIPKEQLERTGPGSVVQLDDITIRVVGAVHGSGGRDALYGGPALGFFITFENGYTLYFSGSTDITMDMQLWGSLYKPDAALIYYPGSNDPEIAAQMVRLLSTDNPGLKTIIPHHHRLNPPAEKDPTVLGEAMAALGLSAELIDPSPGEVYTLSR